MQGCWLNREGTQSCILFMAGWGMGPEPFKELVHGPVDVIMVYDYRNLDDFEISTLLPDTRRLHLLAWSMGVWAAGRLLADIDFASATAIGGPCRPIDDKRGIPGQVFEANSRWKRIADTGRAKRFRALVTSSTGVNVRLHRPAPGTSGCSQR